MRRSFLDLLLHFWTCFKNFETKLVLLANAVSECGERRCEFYLCQIQEQPRRITKIFCRKISREKSIMLGTCQQVTPFKLLRNSSDWAPSLSFNKKRGQFLNFND